MKVRGKDRRAKSLVYSGLQALDFTVVNLGASFVNTTIYGGFPLGFDVKVGRIMVVLNGTAAGTCSFNIVYGTAAEGATMVDDTSDYGAPGYAGWTYNNTSGTKMFAADQVLTMTAGLVQQFTPAFPEGIWQQGGQLTLRLVTNGSATASENVTVIMYGVPVDTKPTVPMASSTAAGAPHTFNWATDI